jgi:multiple sugar transport system permease protein
MRPAALSLLAVLAGLVLAGCGSSESGGGPATLNLSAFALELVLGMLLALVMHRTVIGRGLVRTSALVPYGIIAVVAAFAWRFAWSTAEGGFVPKLLGWTFDPTATTEPFWNYVVVILTEVWKTTPFMALLLLAGLTLVPEELQEAAKVDGATPFQALVRVIAPLAAPGLFTTIILVFIFAWNDFVFAFTLTATSKAQTVPAAIALFPGASQFTQPTGSIAAAAMVVTVPIIVLVMIFQRRIVAGLTAGAVKG